MSGINYSEKIPNNVGLSSNKRLQRALEHWQPKYIQWWKDMGPQGFQDYHQVYVRTAVSVDPPVCAWKRSAWLRGPGTHQSAFGTEQTIDQLAQAANMDPIAFRKLNLDMSLLTSQRLVTLFDAIAQEAKWEARPPASKVAKGNVVTGQGFAVSGFSGTNVANLARVEVNKTTGKIRVTHLYGFGDAGLAVNPDAIESQFLGGMVFFLSKTMVEEVRFDRKAVTSSDWVTYPILRFKDSPGVIVAKVLPRNDLPATAVGEAGGQGVAAAVANAFYDATGVRVRRIPLTPARIRAVLANGGDGPAGFGVST